MLRRCVFLVAGLVWLAPTVAAGQGPQAVPMFGPDDRTAIEAVVNAYFDAFTAKDYASFPKYFQAPFLSFARQPAVVPTIEGVVALYQGIREPLDRTDYASSKVAELRIIPVTFERALANVHWQRFKKDGSQLMEGSECLVVSKTSGVWKIAGIMPQQLALFGK